MRKILSTIALTSLAILPLQADLQMTIMDKDGTQIKQCIKSYSFSNNLESLAKQKGLVQDVVSYDETLTNRVFLGKPVYRKIVNLGNLSSMANDSGIWKNAGFNISNMDTQISAIRIGSVNKSYGYIASNTNQYRDTISKNNYHFLSSTNHKYTLLDVRFIVEYTKTTDTVNNTQNTFKSYLHYIPSSSNTNEVVTHDLENSGVIFDKNYTYDSSTDTCTKN